MKLYELAIVTSFAFAGGFAGAKVGAEGKDLRVEYDSSCFPYSASVGNPECSDVVNPLTGMTEKDHLAWIELHADQ